jgi:hypothetical protein
MIHAAAPFKPFIVPVSRAPLKPHPEIRIDASSVQYRRGSVPQGL